MSRKTTVLVIGVGATLLASTSLAAFVTPVSATATSEWANNGLGDGALIHITDGSGLDVLSTSGVHDNNGNASNMWHGGPNNAGLPAGNEGNPPVVADQAIVFDLGGLFDVTDAYIWNHNQLSNTGRGVATLDILVSADGVSYTSAVGGSTNLLEAGGAPGEGVQTVSLSGANGVRFIQFDIQTTHSGSASDYVGLSEVHFEAVPEPGSLALLGLGSLALLRRRRA